jgi:hypothetical protein
MLLNSIWRNGGNVFNLILYLFKEDYQQLGATNGLVYGV